MPPESDPNPYEVTSSGESSYTKRVKATAGDGDLGVGDWLLCIFCSGIACIVGIIRLIQGKPNAGKMIGIAILFNFLWVIVRFMLEAALQNQR
jgi:hypothetical protein